MTTALHLLCAGAAPGLVKALLPQLKALTGPTLAARFDAVGAMQEALLAGEPCDLMPVTDKRVGELVAAGRLRAETRSALGWVRTGIAVPAGAARPDVRRPEGLKSALLAAEAVYFPDPARATAGIHCAKVLRELGIFEALGPRMRTFPNGATTMRERAAHTATGGPPHIGCTQVSETLYTDGVALVGALPDQFEPATLYTAAVGSAAALPALAERVISLLAGPGSRALREAGGFEF